VFRDGRLKVGDRVLEINGADATKVPLSEAYEMLNKSDATVTLLVEYNVSVIGRFHSCFECPLLKLKNSKSAFFCSKIRKTI